MIATRLTTERLELLPLKVEYAGEMAGVLSAGELYGFTGGEPPSVEQLTERYRRQVAGPGHPGEYWLNWVISLNGVLVGYVQATVTGDVAEIAWVVGANWQGQGIAKEAATGLAEWLRHSRREVERQEAAPNAAGELRIVAHMCIPGTRRRRPWRERWGSKRPVSWTTTGKSCGSGEENGTGPLRRIGAGLLRLWGSDRADVLRLRALGALGEVELDLLVLVQGPEAVRRDRRVVHEHVGAAAVLGDEAEALFAVEPLHCSASHDLLLWWGGYQVRRSPAPGLPNEPSHPDRGPEMRKTPCGSHFPRAFQERTWNCKTATERNGSTN
jgi:RimJ/RimL family protein N-acetyltransferase